MREVLAAAGAPLESAGRILDFTCGAGRALRWLTELAAARFADASGPDRREIWGTDVSAPHVVWLRQHLCPPLRAATRSTNPHLPFEDRYFDLIWSLTPFGRPPDLADAWLLELRRVLRPGGKLYLAVLDKEAFEKLSDPQIETDGNQALLRAAFALQELQALLKSDFASLAVPTPLGIVVVYDRDYLLGAWEREWRLVSATPRASGPCMAYLLERI
jgi:SAM-dependent methyltransferase